MQIIIDVTATLQTKILTGIQRVVREITLRLLNNNKVSVILLEYDFQRKVYTIIDNNDFIKFLNLKEPHWSKSHFQKEFTFNRFVQNSVLLELDAVWHSANRDVLYRDAKAAGIKIVNYIYDIVPITNPELHVDTTIIKFSYVIGSALEYSDFILSETQYTLDEIKKLQKQIFNREIPMMHTLLGSDFIKEESDISCIDSSIASAINAGKYILQVGSVTQNKNHKLVLDAFDNGLFTQGLNYIIAGDVGWGAEELKERINCHPLHDKQLFVLGKVDDAALNALYANAYLLAFPSKIEGYGLPPVEALLHGTPVIASDIPVLHEVLKDYCEYVGIDDHKGFTAIVEKYLHDDSAYKKQKEIIAKYKAIQWEEVSDKIIDACNLVLPKSPYPISEQAVNQFVIPISSADTAKYVLPFIEGLMPFISEVIVICTSDIADKILNAHSGKIKLTIKTVASLSDISAIYSSIINDASINDTFILSSGNYRPIRRIEISDFIKDGKYKIFLSSNSDSYNFNSPQIIDKRIFKELQPYALKDEDNIIKAYIDHLTQNYPGSILNTRNASIEWYASPCVTSPSLRQFLFEAFDKELYAVSAPFESLSEAYYPGIETESLDKIAIYMNKVASDVAIHSSNRTYSECYNFVSKQYPYLKIEISESNCSITLPKYMVISASSTAEINFKLDIATAHHTSSISCRIIDVEQNLIYQSEEQKLQPYSTDCQVAIKSPAGNFRATFEVSVTFNGKTYTQDTPILIIS